MRPSPSFGKHRELSFAYAKILVGDSSGKSVIVGAKDGKLLIEESGPEFWKQIKQDGVRAITEFKLLGRIGALTLVDRKPEGDNHSHRYLVVFKDVMAMEVM